MVAAICKDSLGSLVHAWTKIIPPCGPNRETEFAALLAFKEASKLGLKIFVLEGDALASYRGSCL
jgi:hypothetical protein